tara:strand:- start:681 stop:896 length:216 start_codon:yes stop_codon:yes gene_type:complete
MNKKILLLSIIFKIIFVTNAHAYLDPGSGSIILQAILGFIAAGIASISFYWSKFKNFLVKLFRKNKKKAIE